MARCGVILLIRILFISIRPVPVDIEPLALQRIEGTDRRYREHRRENERRHSPANPCSVEVVRPDRASDDGPNDTRAHRHNARYSCRFCPRRCSARNDSTDGSSHGRDGRRRRNVVPKQEAAMKTARCLTRTQMQDLEHDLRSERSRLERSIAARIGANDAAPTTDSELREGTHAERGLAFRTLDYALCPRRRTASVARLTPEHAFVARTKLGLQKTLDSGSRGHVVHPSWTRSRNRWARDGAGAPSESTFSHVRRPSPPCRRSSR